MSLAHLALAEASMAQVLDSSAGGKRAPKRTAVALPDRKLAPEPR